MLPSNYSSPGGPKVEDQWAGIMGIVTSQLDDENTLWSALVMHPDDMYPSEIVIRKKDVEVIKNEI
jgi:hypothetical protein